MPSDLWNRAMHDAETGRLQEAIASVRMRQRMKPKDPEVTELLGLLLQRAGDLEQSLHYLQRGVELLPGEPIHHHNLATALLAAGRVQQAIDIWKRTLQMAPNLELAWMGLLNGYLEAGDSAKAIEAGERGLACTPDWPDLVANHATALERAGRLEEAIDALERFLERHPGEHLLRSNLLLLLNYTSRDRQRIRAEHDRFGAWLPLAPGMANLTHGNATHTSGPHEATAPTDARAPLRIGVLSSDLRSHSVGFFVEAFMRERPTDVQLIAFSNAPPSASDPVMQRLRALSTRWHDVAALGDQALDALIRSEGLHLLLELNGHTAGGRLSALAGKPAPVIVSAIGYPNTTGLPSIDWRLVDSITDPEGSEAFCSERLMRLDPCFLCYTPPDAAPEPAMPPPDAAITFGSFNNASKIGPETVALWSRVLLAVPDARLLLKSRNLGDPAACAALQRRFEQSGVAPERIEPLAFAKDRQHHLQLYERVHVALDTVPYNGTTTTCEALWMGVPVVTTLGDRHAARVSASLLHAAGFPEWVANDADAFVRIATQLATDRSRLASLRGSMRSRLAASPLLDASGYAMRFHAALRQCWNLSRGSATR